MKHKKKINYYKIMPNICKKKLYKYVMTCKINHILKATFYEQKK